jgi:hypothetical protein
MDPTTLQTPKRQEEFLIVRKVEGELLVYDRRSHQGYCLNKTMSVIWDQLDGRSTVPEISKRLSQWGVEDIDESVVREACESLSACDLLMIPPKERQSFKPVRRSILKGVIGVNAAVVAPAITAFSIPSAYAQASCVPKFGACNVDSDCCPNCRCTGAGFCSGNC